MRIVVACDHRGFEKKRRLMTLLRDGPHAVEDVGCHVDTQCDYPDYALLAARAVAEGRADVALMLDGSGIGMAIVANKVCGVYAVDAFDEVTARRAREHHGCNALCLGVDLLGDGQISGIVDTFLEATAQDGRQKRRVEKVREIEARACRPVGEWGK